MSTANLPNTLQTYEPSPYALVDPNTGAPYSLMVGPNTIGRCDASVAAKDPSFINLYTPRAAVSRAHASVVIAPNEDAWLEDNNSTNGTMIAIREGEGLRLEPKRFYQLFDGTRIVFGEVEVVFVHLGSVSQHPNSLHNTAPSGNSSSPADLAVPKASTTLSREGTGHQIASIIGQRCAEHQRVFSNAFLSPSGSEAALITISTSQRPPANPHSPLAPPSENPPPVSGSQIQRQVSSGSITPSKPLSRGGSKKGSTISAMKNDDASAVLLGDEKDNTTANTMPEALPSITKLQEEYQAPQQPSAVASSAKAAASQNIIPPTLCVGEDAGVLPSNNNPIQRPLAAPTTSDKTMKAPEHQEKKIEEEKEAVAVVVTNPPVLNIGVAIPYLDDEEEESPLIKAHPSTATKKGSTTALVAEKEKEAPATTVTANEKDTTPPTRTKGAKASREDENELKAGNAEVNDEEEKPIVSTKKSRKEPPPPAAVAAPKPALKRTKSQVGKKEEVPINPPAPVENKSKGKKEISYLEEPTASDNSKKNEEKAPATKTTTTTASSSPIAASSTNGGAGGGADVMWEWPNSKKVIACLSGMDAMEKEKVFGRITFLGGDVHEEWGPKVNVLVVGEGAATRTPKFMMAVGRGIPVVKSSLLFLDKAGLRKRGVADAELSVLLSSASILREFTPSLTHGLGDREASTILNAITKNFAVAKAITKRPAAGCLAGLTISVVGIPAKTRPVVAEILIGCGASVAKTKKDEEKLLPKAAAGSTFKLTSTEHVESVYSSILDGTGKVSI